MKLKLEAAAGIIVIIILVGAFFYIRPALLRPEALVIECTTDSECAPAGCSSQICTTAEKAPSVITTCEFRDEWACLAETSCGCNAGKCSWGNTPEYGQCLEALKK